MKATWRSLSGLIHPNPSNSQMKLKVNDDIITDSSTIVSATYIHFSEVAPFLNTNIPSLPDDPVENIKVFAKVMLMKNIR